MRIACIRKDVAIPPLTVVFLPGDVFSNSNWLDNLTKKSHMYPLSDFKSDLQIYYFAGNWYNYQI